jgi:hypothetical protein
MSRPMSPEEVIDVTGWLPDDAVVEHAVVIVQYRTCDDIGQVSLPRLAQRCDGFAGPWLHLGMVGSLEGDLRWALSPEHYVTPDES